MMSLSSAVLKISLNNLRPLSPSIAIFVSSSILVATYFVTAASLRYCGVLYEFSRDLSVQLSGILLSFDILGGSKIWLAAIVVLRKTKPPFMMQDMVKVPWIMIVSPPRREFSTVG